MLVGNPISSEAASSALAKSQLKSAVHPRNLSWYEDGSRPQKYRDAASQLGNILTESSPTRQQTVTQVNKQNL